MTKRTEFGYCPNCDRKLVPTTCPDGRPGCLVAHYARCVCFGPVTTPAPAATEETKECPVCFGTCPLHCKGSGPAETLGRLADSLPTSAEDERVIDELMGRREVVVRSMARTGHEFAYRCINCGAYQADATRPCLNTMSASSEVAPTREDGAGANESPASTTSEPAGTIRDPNPHIGSSLDSLAEELGEDYDRGGPSDEELAWVRCRTEIGLNSPVRENNGNRALYEAGRASRDEEVTDLIRAVTARMNERDTAADNCNAALAELSEKDARIASLTQTVAEFSDSIDGEHALNERLIREKQALTDRIAGLESARAELLERCKAMDVRVAELTEALDEVGRDDRAVLTRYVICNQALGAALRMCLAELEKWRPLIQVVTDLRNFGSIVSKAREIYDVHDAITGLRERMGPFVEKTAVGLLDGLRSRGDFETEAIEAARKALEGTK